MTIKEYLSQLTDIRLRIEAIERSIEKCYSNAEKTTSTTSEVPNHTLGTTSNKVEENVLKVVEYKQQLESLENQFEEFAFRATCEINKIQDNVLVALLINKYVCGLTWEEVSEIIDKNLDYTKKELHTKALKEFEKMNPNYPSKSPCIPA